jgi:hypothetical protein
VGIDFEDAISVQIADLDLMHHGFRLAIEFLKLESASSVAAQHGHDAVIVGGNGDGRLAVVVDAAHLGTRASG